MVIGDHVARRARRLGEVRVRQDAEHLGTDVGGHRERARVGRRRTARENRRAARDHEAPHHRAVGRVPQPVADLGVEGIDLVAPPRRHAVVEPEQRLRAVVDRTERVQHGALPVRRVLHSTVGVRERDIEPFVALPRSYQPGERSPLRVVSHGADATRTFRARPPSATPRRAPSCGTRPPRRRGRSSRRRTCRAGSDPAGAGRSASGSRATAGSRRTTTA